MRYEIPQLPLCTLQESLYPYSFPSFPAPDTLLPAPAEEYQSDKSTIDRVPMSHYYFLAEISLRRLLNRIRHAATALNPNMDSDTVVSVAENITQLEEQLQQWLICLPSCLQFRLPPDDPPAAEEPELVKLMRERYAEVLEVLCRAFLYICIHAPACLSADQARDYGARASTGLRLNIYRVQTERPYYRHAGSWIGCRVRFNQALCLLAAVRAKAAGIASAAHIFVPADWEDCVNGVKERLETWTDEGGGVQQLSEILVWLTQEPVI
jgi:hypothetical protein